MANQEHLNILRKGVDGWNQWRLDNPHIVPDFSEADLSGTNLFNANLSQAQLRKADLAGATLRQANLASADLFAANLHGASLPWTNMQEADLREAKLIQANLRAATLTRANLEGGLLVYADLVGATLIGVNLKRVDLQRANLTETDLTAADLTRCYLGWTLFGTVDLSNVQGLKTVFHGGPSMIGIDTIYRSKGKIPLEFLRGAGVPNNLIEYMHSLVGTAFEYHSCFISYSNKDQEFASRIYADLQGKEVRSWFAPEDLKIGDKLRPSFDEAIRLHDKLMVLLSESSVNSVWVEKEVETAFEKERQQNRIVLFPIRLDDAVMDTNEAWAADIRRTRHIGDFRNWKDHDSYKKAFDRLLRDLRAGYKAELAAEK